MDSFQTIMINCMYICVLIALSRALYLYVQYLKGIIKNREEETKYISHVGHNLLHRPKKIFLEYNCDNGKYSMYYYTKANTKRYIKFCHLFREGSIDVLIKDFYHVGKGEGDFGVGESSLENITEGFKSVTKSLHGNKKISDKIVFSDTLISTDKYESMIQEDMKTYLSLRDKIKYKYGEKVFTLIDSQH